MILSNVGIREALEFGRIDITPIPNDNQYDTSSLGLRLGQHFKRYREGLVGLTGVTIVVDPDLLLNYRSWSGEYMEVIPSSREDGSTLMKPDEFAKAQKR